MLKIRQNSLARTGAQIGGGQGEVQGRLVAIYLSAKTVTLPLLLRIGLHPWHRIINCNCPLAIGLRIVTAPLQGFPQCKGLRREPRNDQIRNKAVTTFPLLRLSLLSTLPCWSHKHGILTSAVQAVLCIRATGDEVVRIHGFWLASTDSLIMLI